MPQAGLAANGGGRLPRELLEAEWEAHANLAYSHLACANLEDGTREYYASASYSHTVRIVICSVSLHTPGQIDMAT